MKNIDLSNINNLPPSAFFFNGGQLFIGDKQPVHRKHSRLSDQQAFGLVDDMKKRVAEIKRVDEETKDQKLTLSGLMREKFNVPE